MTADLSALLAEVADERARQDAKWGGVPGIDRRDDHTYAAVLGEEFGEVCKAWLERDTSGLRVELIQTAAAALAWIAELDNGGSVPRPDGPVLAQACLDWINVLTPLDGLIDHSLYVGTPEQMDHDLRYLRKLLNDGLASLRAATGNSAGDNT